VDPVLIRYWPYELAFSSPHATFAAGRIPSSLSSILPGLPAQIQHRDERLMDDRLERSSIRPHEWQDMAAVEEKGVAGTPDASPSEAEGGMQPPAGDSHSAAEGAAVVQQDRGQPSDRKRGRSRSRSRGRSRSR
jgi:hypothetical protein